MSTTQANEEVSSSTTTSTTMEIGENTSKSFKTETARHKNMTKHQPLPAAAAQPQQQQEQQHPQARLTKPKRPLTAYNIFFHEERANLLGIELLSIYQLRHRQTETTAIPNERRKHRKTHGKVGFTELSQHIAKKWRELPEEERLVYKTKQGHDLVRYRKERSQYDLQQQERNAAGSCSEAPAASTPSASPTTTTTPPTTAKTKTLSFLKRPFVKTKKDSSTNKGKKRLKRATATNNKFHQTPSLAHVDDDDDDEGEVKDEEEINDDEDEVCVAETVLSLSQRTVEGQSLTNKMSSPSSTKNKNKKSSKKSEMIKEKNKEQPLHIIEDAGIASAAAGTNVTREQIPYSIRSQYSNYHQPLNYNTVQQQIQLQQQRDTTLHQDQMEEQIMLRNLQHSHEQEIVKRVQELIQIEQHQQQRMEADYNTRMRRRNEMMLLYPHHQNHEDALLSALYSPHAPQLAKYLGRGGGVGVGDIYQAAIPLAAYPGGRPPPAAAAEYYPPIRSAMSTHADDAAAAAILESRSLDTNNQNIMFPPSRLFQYGEAELSTCQLDNKSRTLQHQPLPGQEQVDESTYYRHQHLLYPHPYHDFVGGYGNHAAGLSRELHYHTVETRLRMEREALQSLQQQRRGRFNDENQMTGRNINDVVTKEKENDTKLRAKSSPSGADSAAAGKGKSPSLKICLSRGRKNSINSPSSSSSSPAVTVSNRPAGVSLGKNLSKNYKIVPVQASVPPPSSSSSPKKESSGDTTTAADADCVAVD